MTDHPTLEPTTAVRVRASEPSGAAAPAAFADLVCADHELLRAEFDAIIAANFPAIAGRGQRLRPATAVTTTTRPMPARRVPARPVPQAVRARAGTAQNLRARQRGPPGQLGSVPGTGTSMAGHEQEVVVSTDTTHI